MTFALMCLCISLKFQIFFIKYVDNNDIYVELNNESDITIESGGGDNIIINKYIKNKPQKIVLAH